MEIDIVKYKAQDLFSVEEIAELINKHNPYLIDVRSWEEYCQGHLCGAHFIETHLPPLYQKDFDHLKETLSRICVRDGKESLILVYCKLGKRAGLAKTLLQNLGYKNVLSLGGVDTEPLKTIMKGKTAIRICLCKT